MRISARTICPGVHPDWQHARKIGIGFDDGHTGLQPRNALEPETGKDQIAAVKRERHHDVEVCIGKAEALMHNADYFARPRVHGDVAPDDRAVSAESPLPVAITEHHALWATRNLIRLREPSPDRRWNVQRLKRTITNFHCAHLLRLSKAHNARGSGIPHSQ